MGLNVKVYVFCGPLGMLHAVIGVSKLNAVGYRGGSIREDRELVAS